MIAGFNRFLGWSVVFQSGLSFGWNWTHGNGESSKTSACIASYHHPDSITWRWALYYSPPMSLRSALRWPAVRPCYNRGTQYWAWSNFSGDLILPLLGSLHLSTQAHMFRKTEPTEPPGGEETK